MQLPGTALSFLFSEDHNNLPLRSQQNHVQVLVEKASDLIVAATQVEKVAPVQNRSIINSDRTHRLEQTLI